MQATVTYHFSVAGFTFAVELPHEYDIESLLPSFAPFRCPPTSDEQLFVLTLDDTPFADDGELWDETTNDLGLTRLYKTAEGYRVALQYTPQGPVHTMIADERFTTARVNLSSHDKYAGQVLSSLLRLAFAQAIVWHRAISIHASAVVCDGKGYLFMGKSGTGKSTHTRLWLEHIPGSSLLNDDNPIVRVVGDEVVAYGSPWSGKTHCYKSESAPVAGFIRLRQAPYNRYMPCEDIAAFKALLPGSSVLRQDKTLHSILCGTLIEIAGMTKVGEMECLPDKAAAETCFKNVCK
jgi:hypothetical protein